MKRKVPDFRIVIFIGAIVAIGLLGYVKFNSSQEPPPQETTRSGGTIISGSIDSSRTKPESEWKKILTTEQYRIMREKGTEIPYTGELNNEKRQGTYYSVGCDIPLFRSESKFDSGTGWPSFTAPVDDNSVVLRTETGIGDDRIEVVDRCGNHLGHVFDDGPAPTGKRYCINSVALRFVPD